MFFICGHLQIESNYNTSLQPVAPLRRFILLKEYFQSPEIFWFIYALSMVLCPFTDLFYVWNAPIQVVLTVKNIYALFLR